MAELPPEYQEAFARARARAGAPQVSTTLPTPAEAQGGLGFFEGLAKSTLSAAGPELVGRDPLMGVEPFRHKHPIASFLTQAVGFGVPFVATEGLGAMALRGLGATAKVAEVAKTTGLVGRAAKYATAPLEGAAHPFAQAAVQEMIRFAPVEAARVGAAAVLGDPYRVAQQALFNIPAAGVIGGIFRGLPASVKGTFPGAGETPGSGTRGPFTRAEGEILRKVAGWQTTDPPHIKLRKLDELLTKNADTVDPELRYAIDEYIHGWGGDYAYHGLRGDVLKEVPEKGKWAYVQPMEGNADARQLTPWFQIGAEGGRHVKTLTLGANGFSQETAPILDAAISSMPKGWEAYTITPRIVTFQTKAAANRFREVIHTLRPVKDGVWMGRETDDGFYVVARKILGEEVEAAGKGAGKGGKSAAGEATDHWMVYKTDQPGYIDPELAAENADIQRNLWGRHWEDQSEIAHVGGQVIRGDKAARIGPLQYYMPRENVQITTRLPDGTIAVDNKLIGLQDTEMGRVLRSMEEATPGLSDLMAANPKDRAWMLSKALMKYMPEYAQHYRGGVETMFNAFGRVLKPLTTQFEKAPMLLRALGLTQALLAKAHSRGVDQWQGLRVFGENQPGTIVGKTLKAAGIVKPGTPLSSLFSKPKIEVPGPKAIFDKMTNGEAAIVENIQGHPDAAPDWLQKQDWIPDRVKQFFSMMHEIDRKNLAELNTLRRLNGLDPIEWMPWHFGITRKLYWGHKLPVVVQEAGEYNGVKFNKGDVLEIVDGRTRGEVAKKAEEVMKEVEKYGLKAGYKKEMIAGEEVTGKSGDLSNLNWQLETAGKMNADQQRLLVSLRFGHAPIPGDPMRALASTRAIQRFAFLRPTPKKELGDRIFGSILEMNAWIAKQALDHRIGGDLSYAARRWTGMTHQAVDRIAKLHGQRGPIATMIDSVSDQFLGPILGRNSASRIVHATNGAMHALTLGFFDVGHAAMNTMTFAQTTMPEVAFVLNAAPEQQAKYYAWELVKSGDKIMPVGFFTPLNIMREAFQDMWSKDPKILEFIERGIADGHISPRFAENILGDIEEKIGYKTLVGHETNFADWVGNLSKYLPAKSEELSRLHTMLAGRRLAMDYKGLEGEQAYAFVSKFMKRTMYDYVQGARPQVLTGPAGGAIGLFKNWQFNYLANLKTYSAEALRGNFAPLLWSTLGTGAVGGAAAVPFWFTAEAAANLLANESAMEFLYDKTGYKQRSMPGKYAIDTFQYGLPWLIGLSLQGRAEVPGANAVRDLSTLFSAVSLDRMKTLGQAGQELWDAWSLTGTHPGNYPKGRDMLIKATMPRTVYRSFQAVGSDGIRSLMTGNQISPAISPLEKAAFIVGLTPGDVQKAYDMMDIEVTHQEHYDKTLAIYGALGADAIQNRDYRYLNHLVPRALMDGVMPQSLLRSIQSRLQKREQPAQVRIDKKLAFELQSKLGTQ